MRRYRLGFEKIKSESGGWKIELQQNYKSEAPEEKISQFHLSKQHD